MRRKKILLCGEATFLKTGYGIYGKEILSRLHDTGKYQIAELGAYGKPTDERRHSIPWRYYGTMPMNSQEQEFYEKNQISQFGDWRFEDTCLDFRPDIVIDIRDWWMLEHEERSPFRPFYKWLIMPAVDSTPQQEQYISTYMNADMVFQYSDWGRDVLLSETKGRLRVQGVPSPAANYDVFQPVSNKKHHRDNAGFLPDVNIVGTIMRNQRRKLYPDLIEAFKIFLKKNPSLAAKTFLYLHTSYPDSGWDIPLLIRESGIGHKILVTYKCANCGHFFPSFFQDARMACLKCGAAEARMPNSEMGVTSEELAQIINYFDLYVQYSVCEGFGMPQVESAACGVPVMAVNYSAMETVAPKLGGLMIDVKRFFRESESHAWRALPDDEHCAELIARFLRKPSAIRNNMGHKAYSASRLEYNWDKAAKIWEDAIDSIEIHEGLWDSSPRIHNPYKDIPNLLDTGQFVRWAVSNVLGEPHMADSYMANRMIRDLNYKTAILGTGGMYVNEASYLDGQARYESFDRQKALVKLSKMCENRNYWERRRAGIIDEGSKDFVKIAKPGEYDEV